MVESNPYASPHPVDMVNDDAAECSRGVWIKGIPGKQQVSNNEQCFATLRLDDGSSVVGIGSGWAIRNSGKKVVSFMRIVWPLPDSDQV